MVNLLLMQRKKHKNNIFHFKGSLFRIQPPESNLSDPSISKCWKHFIWSMSIWWPSGVCYVLSNGYVHTPVLFLCSLEAQSVNFHQNSGYVLSSDLCRKTRTFICIYLGRESTCTEPPCCAATLAQKGSGSWNHRKRRNQSILVLGNNWSLLICHIRASHMQWAWDSHISTRTQNLWYYCLCSALM